MPVLASFSMFMICAGLTLPRSSGMRFINDTIYVDANSAV